LWWEDDKLGALEKVKRAFVFPNLWPKQKDILKDRLKLSLYKFTERFFYTLGGAPIVVLGYSASNSNFVEFTNVGSVFMAMQN